jgi:predicted phage terminase large subunit-like protein
VIDDPHNISKGDSVAERLFTLQWWDEAMPTRINHPTESAKIIIMQRVNQKDLTGHILSKELDYVHLCLPARYELKHPTPTKTPLAFKDPRSKIGEPLWKELYDNEALSLVEIELTEYARAGQLQQRPSPRGGGIFKVENFILRKEMPKEVVRAVRYWDKAATQDGGKRSAGVLMALLKDGNVCICDVQKGQWSSGKREKLIRMTAELDEERFLVGSTTIWIEQEPGSGGKESAENTITNLIGYAAYIDVAHANKIARSEPYQAALYNEKVEVVIAWAQEFIDEHERAPAGEFQDQWDAASGAFNKLMKKNKKRVGVW